MQKKVGDIVGKELVLWYGNVDGDSEMFIIGVPNIESGVTALRTIATYDTYLVDNKLRSDAELGGGLAFLGSDGKLEPWEYIDIENGGKKYTDPMEYLTDKYEKTQIIV
jgi:hypothetical protein